MVTLRKNLSDWAEFKKCYENMLILKEACKYAIRQLSSDTDQKHIAVKIMLERAIKQQKEFV
jgi:hypothetical protein